jgi:regulation of enolase protein 1 (concanavalin A-like superfamily)
MDPNGNFKADNAPTALFTPPDDHFLLSARVHVDFAAMYDAGTLQVRQGSEWGAKLCFEYSPQGEAMIVSVVTRGLSDDCNSVVINGREVYLRLACTPKLVIFHYSLDGHIWHFVRYLTLHAEGAAGAWKPGKMGGLQAGFGTQSPAGEGCRVVFSEISYRTGTEQDPPLANNRSGV